MRVSELLRSAVSSQYRYERRVSSVELQLMSPTSPQDIQKERRRMETNSSLKFAINSSYGGAESAIMADRQDVQVHQLTDQEIDDRRRLRLESQLIALKQRNPKERVQRRYGPIEPTSEVRHSTLRGMFSLGQFNPRDLDRK